MKKGFILLGTLSVGLLTACIVFNNNQVEEGKYQPRSSAFMQDVNGADGYLEFLHSMRGDVTKEQYRRISELIDAMPANRATVDWNEMGPDNIGGRCRAILIDNDNINHIYAGSVTGGLFESFERANWWTKVEAFEDNLAVSSMCQTVDGTIYVATGFSEEQSSGSQQGYDTGTNGNGMYILNRDASQMTTTVTHIPGSDDYTWINEIVCDTLNNRIWVATNQGLELYDPVGQTFTAIDNGLSAGSCGALSISPDGQVIVAGMSSGKTNVSIDYGATFVDMTQTSGTANPISAGASRMEYAISHEKGTNGNYYIYAVGGNQYLTGAWMSDDNGQNWTQIAPANNQAPGSFAPFSNGVQGQAYWDMILSVQKGNPEKVFLGGINTFSWATNGNWAQLSNSQLGPQSTFYVHADNHEMKWDKWGRLYIGNDGGVFFSDDGGAEFHQANRGFNVTQYYEIGASAHGDLIGGAQDNGTTVNYHDNSTWHEFDEVYGGDGFSCHISFINRNIIFASSQYGGFGRSGDRGQNFNIYVPDEFSTSGLNNIGCNPGASGAEACGNFFSVSHLWENPNDVNSEDSVSFIPGQAYSPGDTIDVPSLTTGVFIPFITPDSVVFDDTVVFNAGLTTQDTIITTVAPSNDYNLDVFNWNYVSGGPSISAGDSIYLSDIDTTVEVLSFTTIPHYYATNPADPGDVYDMGNDPEVYGVAWDTLFVQDPYQSWFAIGLGGSDGLWLTRNALRFSADASDWFKVNHTALNGDVSQMEFSRDGNHLFVGTHNGSLYRLSNIGGIYSPEKDVDTLMDVNNVPHPDSLSTTWTQIGTFGAPVTGIGVDGDPDHVVITLGLYAGTQKVRESLNATGAATFTNISGNLPQIDLAGGGPTSLPVYSVVIDRDDPNTIVIGTDQGAYVTTNGGTTWENCSGPMGKVPVFDMLQNWRTWNEGCYRPGEIYAGTHGRGIFASESFLSTPDQDQLALEKYVPSGINVYPNPMADQGNIAFTLESSSNVNIRIFNLSGQLVQEINEINVTAGENNISFGVSELPPGAYIIRLAAGERVETSKFIKH